MSHLCADEGEQARHRHSALSKQPSALNARRVGDDRDGDDQEWDPHADQEISSLRAGAVKFTLSDGRDPDAVVQLRMGRDLGIYASTRSTRRRIDAVAPGRPGLLAAYSTSGTIAPVEWMHAEVDDETGEAVALRVALDVAVRDVLIQDRGSVGSAIDALREAAILADRHRLALERTVQDLGKALASSEARVDDLTRLVESMQYIRVEHESKETADAWSFRTSMRPDGTHVFGVTSADGVSRGTFCARPPPPRRPTQDESADARPTPTESEAPTSLVEPHGTPPNDIEEEHAAIAHVAHASDALVEEGEHDAPLEKVLAPDDVEAAGESTETQTDIPPIKGPFVEAEPALPALVEPAAIPVPTTVASAPTQQRRTKGGRKARTSSAATTTATLESPGSPPPARGVKTRQSARRASSHSAPLAGIDHPAAITMARPGDDVDTA